MANSEISVGYGNFGGPIQGEFENERVWAASKLGSSRQRFFRSEKSDAGTAKTLTRIRSSMAETSILKIHAKKNLVVIVSWSRLRVVGKFRRVSTFEIQVGVVAT